MLDDTPSNMLNPPKSPNDSTDEYFREKKDDMMKKLEQNIQKTLDTLNNYKYDDDSDSGLELPKNSMQQQYSDIQAIGQDNGNYSDQSGQEEIEKYTNSQALNTLNRMSKDLGHSDLIKAHEQESQKKDVVKISDILSSKKNYRPNLGLGLQGRNALQMELQQKYQYLEDEEDESEEEEYSTSDKNTGENHEEKDKFMDNDVNQMNDVIVADLENKQDSEDDISDSKLNPDTLPNSEIDRMYNRIDDRFKNNFNQNLKSAVYGTGVDKSDESEDVSSDEDLEDQDNSENIDLDKLRKQRLEKLGLKPQLNFNRTDLYKKDMGDIQVAEESADSDEQLKPTLPDFEKTEKLIEGLNDSDKNSESLDEDSDDDIDLDRLRQMTKDKFGLNFGLNELDDDSEDDVIEDEVNLESDRKANFNSLSSNLPIQSQIDMLKQKIQARDEQMEKKSHHSESDFEGKDDTERLIESSTDQHSNEKNKIATKSDLMKEFERDKEMIYAKFDLNKEKKDKNPEIENKTDFFRSKRTVNDEPLKNNFITENSTPSTQHDTQNQQPPLSSSRMSEGIPSWRRELNDKFKKFDQFKKNRSIYEDETSESDDCEDESIKNSVFSSKNKAEDLSKFKIAPGLENKLDMFMKRRQSQEIEKVEESLDLTKSREKPLDQDESDFSQNNGPLDIIKQYQRNKFMKNNSQKYSQQSHDVDSLEQGKSQIDNFSAVNQKEDTQNRVNSIKLRQLEIENKQLKDDMIEIRLAHQEEIHITKEQNENILNSHIQRHQNGIDMVKQNYDSEVEHLSKELSMSRQIIQELKDDNNSTKQELAIVKLKASYPKSKPHCFEKHIQTEKVDFGSGNSNTGNHNNANLERNFLKLKELYDTLYKANLTLMNDQKDLESKYSKLLKAYNKQSQKSSKKTRVTSKQRLYKNSNINKDIHQNLKRRSNSRKRSMSKNDNSFNSNNRVPYSGLENSATKFTNSNESKVKRKVRKSKKKNGSSAQKSDSKAASSIVGDSMVDGSTASYMSFVNDTTMLGPNQSKILNQSTNNEKPDENLFSNSLIKKSVKMRKNRRGSNSRKRIETLNEYNQFQQSRNSRLSGRSNYTSNNSTHNSSVSRKNRQNSREQRNSRDLNQKHKGNKKQKYKKTVQEKHSQDQKITFKSRQSASPYTMKNSQQRNSAQNSASRNSHKNGKQKVFAVPLTEREINYLHKNKSRHNTSDQQRMMRKSAKLNSRENRLHEKSNSKRALNSSIGRAIDKRTGAYTERIGHRRTRTIGGASDSKNWGGLGKTESRKGSRTGRLTSRDGRSNNLYKVNHGSSQARRNHGGSLTERGGRETMRTDLQNIGGFDRKARISNRDRNLTSRESNRGAVTERGGKTENPFNLGRKSGRSVNRGSRTHIDYSKNGNSHSNNRIARSGTDRRHYAGSKSYGNDELRQIIKQKEAREAKNNGSMSNRRTSTERLGRGKSNNLRRPMSKERRSIPSGSLTERGTRSNSRIHSRPKSINSQIKNGSMTERRHNKKYSDVVTGKARNLPKFEQTKIILKKFGKVKGFGVNTHRGCVRNYNEDRVSILLNAQQRFKKIVEAGYKNCCLFGVYDGHGGSQCCNFLKEYLFSYILNEETFTSNPIETLKKSFKQVDTQFVEKIQKVHPLDCSGSCAIVLLILDDMLYFLNVGDSRAILSQRGGKRVIQCSKDHKPSRESESIRIFQNKGIIYRVANIRGKSDPQMITARNSVELSKLKVLEQEDCVLYAGPFRVKPGGLSVSRTFGDIEAKKEIYGGKNGVVVPDPEISTHHIEADDDFVLLASDGVFDTVSNEQIVKIVYDTVSYYKQRSLDPYKEYEQILGACVSNVMKTSLIQQSEDNVTVMIVCFQNLLDLVQNGDQILQISTDG